MPRPSRTSPGRRGDQLRAVGRSTSSLEAISEERVLGAVNTIAGQPIDFGPIGVGPGRIAKVRAYGEIGAAATRDPARSGDADRLPRDAAGGAHLRGGPPGRDPPLRGRAARPADAHGRGPAAACGSSSRPRRRGPARCRSSCRPRGCAPRSLQRVVGSRASCSGSWRSYVARELDKPHVREARTIDVSRAIDAAWASIGPARPRACTDESVDRRPQRRARAGDPRPRGDLR